MFYLLFAVSDHVKLVLPQAFFKDNKKCCNLLRNQFKNAFIATIEREKRVKGAPSSLGRLGPSAVVLQPLPQLRQASHKAG